MYVMGWIALLLEDRDKYKNKDKVPGAKKDSFFGTKLWFKEFYYGILD